MTPSTQAQVTERDAHLGEIAAAMRDAFAGSPAGIHEAGLWKAAMESAGLRIVKTESALSTPPARMDVEELIAARPFQHLSMTIMHNPPHAYGDCQRTCLAMILGMKPEDVPHFGDENLYPPDSDRNVEGEWLHRLGWNLLNVPIAGDWGFQYVRDLLKQWAFDSAIVVSGKSPRGEWNHDIVIYRDEIYDPHPDRTGLVGPCIDKDKLGEPEWFWLHFVTPVRAAQAHVRGEGEKEEIEQAVRIIQQMD